MTTAASTEGQRRPLLEVEGKPAEGAIADVISFCIKIGASDLFFQANDQHHSIMAKHLGEMRMISVVSTEQGKRLVSYLKARAGMDLAERRRPLDGRWIFSAEDGDAVDCRINQIPTIYGEDLAIRLLSRKTKLFNLDILGMTRFQRSSIQAMIDSPGGLVLITGPTGSGKTSTLYGCMVQLNDGRRKINTIEDPIEFALAGVRQSQVFNQIHVGFSELLRSVMRQSPDVIMIGEIRDAETAQIAIHAANSGHLVLATIHATAALGGLQSMRAFGVHPHFLATALRGIVSQRLVRTLCSKCRHAYDLSDAPHTFDEVQHLLQPGEGKNLYAPRGCDSCGMIGYTGRTGVFEVLSITRGIRNLIADNVPMRDVRRKAAEEKWLEFRQAALLKVARGETSMEEVFRVIPSEQLVLDD